MVQAIALVLLSLVLLTDGALNLKIFRDPKDVYVKQPRTPCDAKTSAKRCPAPPSADLLEQDGYLQSQDGIDRCLLESYFPGLCQGSYIEIGALDGIEHSNTYAFYMQLGWKGINIELDPENYQQLAYNRKDDIANIHAAVCSESHEVHYAVGGDPASRGIWEYASDAHRERWWKNMTLYHTIPMKCTSLQSIFDQFQSTGTGKLFFDLATIDLEGGELSALLSIDFDKVT
eukprot:CAMPEP_0183741224 /NCGR_PEP_ID=MMETSP0737-20130205/61559_1 /TAXON_ID=385413 /ORGANISM="Thalassiosira miniscula, Strain CCMP1093" /LENGTH=230 /DNA_ID=CAMNT_0025976487 /DNA_START=83 /DNA_END=772 /DNA_ORIENTATION=+